VSMDMSPKAYQEGASLFASTVGLWDEVIDFASL
jgi:hypothetical protein